MKYIRIVIWPIAFLLLSIVLNFISSTAFFDHYVLGLVGQKRLSVIKDVAAVINHWVLVLPLGILSIIRGLNADRADKIKLRYREKQRECVYSVLQKNQYIICKDDADFNIRIFKKKFRHLVSDDIEGLYEQPIKRRLMFSIKKNEGLCVQSYKLKKTMCEFEDASLEKFNLNKQQMASAGELKFMVAVPVCNGKNNKVKCVICFDSFKKIGVSDNEQQIMKICERAAYDIYDVIQ